MRKCVRAARSQPQPNNFFKLNRMRNWVGRENFLESLLTAFILYNITASMTSDMKTSEGRDSGYGIRGSGFGYRPLGLWPVFEFPFLDLMPWHLPLSPVYRLLPAPST